MAVYTTIDDPSAYFQTTLYTGNGSSGHAITNGGNSDLQPDCVWIKKRDTADHNIFDSTRGTSKHLAPNEVQAEQDVSGVTAFNSDGFTLGTNGDSNYNNGSFVAWQWKANGNTLVSNSESGNNPAGQYQVNTTAGFSIVVYTGSGGAGTMAHGLGAVPHFMIVRNRYNSSDWLVYHHKNTAAPETDYLKLDADSATTDDSVFWNDTAPSSTVFTVGTDNDVNQDGQGCVAYCFTSIQGYSKFGSYVGNGDADGPFVFTGFKPAWVMHKRSNSSGNWFMFDNKRLGYNSENHRLQADANAAEADPSDYDLLSNGFKLRFTSGNVNADGGEYVYAAFAESPFVSSTGIPATAR